MKARVFIQRDMEEMSRWYSLRGLEAPSEGSLPGLLVIVEGIAAVCVYQTDSDIAILEGLVTNPEHSSEVRSQAIDLLAEKAVQCAKEMGFKKIVTTLIPGSLVERAMKAHGFGSPVSGVTLHKEV